MSIVSTKINVKKVDSLNLKCYEKIADEYDSHNHETCRDFDTGSECFLQKAIKLNTFKKGFRYLDIGVGTGRSLEFLMPWLKEMKANVEVLDISPKMIKATRNKFGDKIKKYHTISIHNFQPEKKYDLVFAALCDPYLTKDSIKKFKQCLTEDGILFMTMPTNTWARKVRKRNIHQTTFHDLKRNKHSSYSFCWSKGDLIKFVESVGLINHYSKVILIDEVKKVKKKLGNLNWSLSQKEKRIPMLLTLVFLNKK